MDTSETRRDRAAASYRVPAYLQQLSRQAAELEAAGQATEAAALRQAACIINTHVMPACILALLAIIGGDLRPATVAALRLYCASRSRLNYRNH